MGSFFENIPRYFCHGFLFPLCKSNKVFMCLFFYIDLSPYHNTCTIHQMYMSCQTSLLILGIIDYPRKKVKWPFYKLP